MMNLRFRYRDKIICHRDDRLKDRISSLERNVERGFVREVYKLPQDSMLVGFNLFKALKKFVPNFIVGEDHKWGEFGLGYTMSGMEIKLFESGQPVLHDCTKTVIEALEIQAYGGTMDDNAFSNSKMNNILFDHIDVDIYIY